MNLPQKITLVVHIGQNIAEGRGLPKFVMNLFRFMPRDRFDLILVQSEWCDYKRTSDNDPFYTFDDRDTVLTYRDRSTKVNFMMKNKHLSALMYIVVKPILIRIDATLLPSGIKSQIRKADVVYLTSNYYAPYGKYCKTIVGSCHTFFVSRGLLEKLHGALVKIGLIYRFPVVHAFPGFEKYFNKKKSLVVSLPPPFDASRYRPQVTERDGKIRVLFVSSLDRGKGTDIVIEVSKLLDHGSYEMHIVGRGPMEAEVRRAVNSSLIYHGALDEAELSKLYSLCDIFLYPTKGETYGIVVIEALSSGLLVVASDALKGTFDLYERSGFLRYCQNKANSLANQIRELSTKLPTYEEKTRMHQVVFENNDGSIVVGKLAETLYEYVISHR